MIDRNPKISISILTYNRSMYLEALLLSLKSLTYHPLEIIVVDNNSNDNTREMVNINFPDVCYVKTEKNIGAAARNLGLERATGDIVVTLDDDIIGVTDAHLNILKEYFYLRGNLGAINFKVLEYNTGKICNWVHHCNPGQFGEKEFLTYEITEGAVAFRKKILLESGYYPDNFFLSHEGPDLAYRILNKGYEVIYSNKISVAHHHSDLGRKKWTNYYYDTRNQFWVAARNLPFIYAIFYLAKGLSSMLIYSIRDGYLNFWVRAVMDGVKGMKRAFGDRNVLNACTMKIIRNIDKNRPGLRYVIRNRLFKKEARL